MCLQRLEAYPFEGNRFVSTSMIRQLKDAFNEHSLAPNSVISEPMNSVLLVELLDKHDKMDKKSELIDTLVGASSNHLCKAVNYFQIAVNS